MTEILLLFPYPYRLCKYVEIRLKFYKLKCFLFMYIIQYIKFFLTKQKDWVQYFRDLK